MRDFKVGDFFLILPQTASHLKHIEENDLCRITSVDDDFIWYETIIRNHSENADLKKVRKNSYFLNVMSNFDVNPEEIEKLVKEHQERSKYKTLLMTPKVFSLFEWIANNNGDSEVRSIARDILNPERRSSKEINALSLHVDGFEYTPSNKEIEVHSNGKWTAKVRQKGKFGKIINKILLKQYSDSKLESIGNIIKSYIGIHGDENGEGKYKLEFVYGDDIRKCYSESNYTKLYTSGNGIYGSCMRYDKCQQYFKIYTENPEVCSLAVIKDGDGKIAGRAIVWFDGEDYFMDRIYTTDGLTNVFKQHAIDNNWFYKSQQSNGNYFDRKGKEYGTKKLNLPIKYHYEWKFPYMDTLIYIDPYKHTLGNDIDGDDYIKIRSQSGESERGFSTSIGRGYNGFYKCMASGNILPENDILKHVTLHWENKNTKTVRYISKNMVVTLYNGELAYSMNTYLRKSDAGYFINGDPNFIEVNGSWKFKKEEEEKSKNKKPSSKK